MSLPELAKIVPCKGCSVRCWLMVVAIMNIISSVIEICDSVCDLSKVYDKVDKTEDLEWKVTYLCVRPFFSAYAIYTASRPIIAEFKRKPKLLVPFRTKFIVLLIYQVADLCFTCVLLYVFKFEDILKDVKDIPEGIIAVLTSTIILAMVKCRMTQMRRENKIERSPEVAEI